MSSEARINASRENGKKGGVRTDSGKARSRLNALKHGMFSRKCPVTSTEDAAKFAVFHEEIVDSFQPADKPEQVLVDKIAEYMWRIDRYENSQELFIDFEINFQLDDLEKDNEGVEIEPDLRIALALHECFSSKNSALVECGRFTNALSRKLHRTIQDLATLQGPRFRSGVQPQPQPQLQPDPEPDPEPAPNLGVQPTAPAEEQEPHKNSGNEPRIAPEPAPKRLPILPALSRTLDVPRLKRTLPDKIHELEAPLKAMTA